MLDILLEIQEKLRQIEICVDELKTKVCDDIKDNAEKGEVSE